MLIRRRLTGSESLHVAMQLGPSLRPKHRTFDVWSLRIPTRFTCRPFLLIVWLIALASMNASRLVACQVTTDIGSSLTEHRRIRQVFQQIVEFL